MTAQHLLTSFKQRHAAALDDYHDGPQGIEAKLAFIDGRLADALVLVLFLLELEIEREREIELEK